MNDTIDLDFLNIRERIVAIIKAKNLDEWNNIIRIHYRIAMDITFTYMFSDIMYTFMEDELTSEVAFLDEQLRFNIYSNTSYLAVIHRITLKMYTNNRADLLIHNEWLLKPAQSQLRLKSVIPGATQYLLEFVISNYQHFEINDIWNNIILMDNQTINKEEILKFCIEHELPNIMENLNAVFWYANDMNAFRNILELLLQRNVVPTYKVVEGVIRNCQVVILELFDTYNIDIKRIIQSANKTTSEHDQMEYFLNKFNVSLSEYVSIMDHTT